MNKIFFCMVGLFFFFYAAALPKKNKTAKSALATPVSNTVKPEVPAINMPAASSDPEQTNTEKAKKFQALKILPAPPTEQDIIHSFLKPVQFTKAGMDDFFRTVFNSTIYAERFLPSCFVHMIDFFDYGKKHHKPYSFYESVFNLFHHRLKESNWVNSYALLMFMEQLPEYLDPLATVQHEKMVNLLKVELKRAIDERSFLLKDRAESFYTETVENILATIKKTESEGSVRDLQKSCALFLEHCYGKLIWNPKEKEDIWKLIKLLASKCELLYQFGCLATQDDLNRLLWSLLYRFGYFIECAGGHLPVEFYRSIRDDIDKEMPPFLLIEETEKWLTSKQNYLFAVLDKGEIKAHAYKQGILSDVRIMKDGALK